ncbi:hypothetical protein COCNU_scaffold000363G000040 [Cocos nucifera]|nr:hypothetical protein [Cocos nucifera]
MYPRPCHVEILLSSARHQSSVRESSSKEIDSEARSGSVVSLYALLHCQKVFPLFSILKSLNQVGGLERLNRNLNRVGGLERPNWMMDWIEGKESLSSPEDAKEVRGVLARPLERHGNQENICLENIILKILMLSYIVVITSIETIRGNLETTNGNCYNWVEEPYLMPIVSVHARQVTKCRGQGKRDCNHIDEMMHEGCCLSPSYGVGCGSLATVPAWEGVTESENPACTSSPSSYANTSAISTSFTSVSHDKASSYLHQSESTILSASKKNTFGTISAKVVTYGKHGQMVMESKLNPSAKVFSPSFGNARSTSITVTPVVNPIYMPTSLPARPIAGQSGIEISPFASLSSMPSKFVPYNSIVAGHGGIAAQYPQPDASYF